MRTFVTNIASTYTLPARCNNTHLCVQQFFSGGSWSTLRLDNSGKFGPFPVFAENLSIVLTFQPTNQQLQVQKSLEIAGYLAFPPTHSCLKTFHIKWPAGLCVKQLWTFLCIVHKEEISQKAIHEWNRQFTKEWRNLKSNHSTGPKTVYYWWSFGMAWFLFLKHWRNCKEANERICVRWTQTKYECVGILLPASEQKARARDAKLHQKRLEYQCIMNKWE